MNIQSQIEAILFSADQPVTLEDIIAFFSKTNGMEYSQEEILSNIQKSAMFYNEHNSPLSIVNTGGGYIFKTKSEYHSLIASFLQRDVVKKLTQAALETLAVIAYKQPVTKSEIEIIRGVNCDYTVQKLMERDLVELKGRSEEVGRPLFYGTTDYFLDYFGMNNLEELPKLKEFFETENQIGEKENIIQQD